MIKLEYVMSITGGRIRVYTEYPIEKRTIACLTPEEATKLALDILRLAFSIEQDGSHNQMTKSGD